MNISRIKLVIAYDGTNYSGWQIQDNAVTVEGCIQDALDRLVVRVIGEDVSSNELNKLIGASRTDSGVHALGNVAVFDTNLPLPGDKFAYALNSDLPEDIRILSSEEVDTDFHPRYTESHKTYTYNILNSPVDIPIYSRYMHHVRGELDIKKMKEAAKFIIGEHDFSAFCSAGAQVKTKVRTVFEVDVKKNASNISITVTGNGFLYNMVRIIAGTLIEVGQGRRTPESVKKAIDEKNRELAGPTAPAKGLVLNEIRYL